ncbi:hypothetical protein WMF38_56985 [Sorangium sp. So ce118]
MSEAMITVVTPASAKDDGASAIARDLYNLSRMLGERNPDAQAHGVLGGSWGYGQHFENEVFEMHPYYWGDCTCGHDERQWKWEESNNHSDSCYQAELSRERGAAGLSVFWPDYVRGRLSVTQTARAEKKIYAALCAKYNLPELGCAVHCTCGHQQQWEAFDATSRHDDACPEVVPNFRHKRSGLDVRWYKWIGRSMELSRDVAPAEWASLMAECVASLSGAP